MPPITKGVCDVVGVVAVEGFTVAHLRHVIVPQGDCHSTKSIIVSWE